MWHGTESSAAAEVVAEKAADVKEQASEAVDTAKEKVSKVAEAVADKAADAKETVKDTTARAERYS